MTNFFDQFDSEPSTNFFDQFDRETVGHNEKAASSGGGFFDDLIPEKISTAVEVSRRPHARPDENLDEETGEEIPSQRPRSRPSRADKTDDARSARNLGNAPYDSGLVDRPDAMVPQDPLGSVDEQLVAMRNREQPATVKQPIRPQTRPSRADDTDDARSVRGFGNSSYDSGLVDRPDAMVPTNPLGSVDEQLAAMRRRERSKGVSQEPQPISDHGKRLAEGLGGTGSGFAKGSATWQVDLDWARKYGASDLMLANLSQQRQLIDAAEQEGSSPEREAFYYAQIDALRIGYQKLENAERANPVPASEREDFKTGEAIDQWVSDTFGAPDPQFDDRFLSKLSGGAGSLAGYVSLAVLTQGRSIPVALAGAGQNASSVYEEALEHGASEEEALKASLKASIVGTAEAVPVIRALEVLPKQWRDKVGSAVAQRLARSLQGGGEEAVQEGFTGVMNNLIASEAYDENRGWNEDVLEQMTIGAILGGGMGAIIPNAKDDQRLDSPRLTEADRASALPNATIDDGKAAIEQMLAQNAPEIPASVPEGATPLDILYPGTAQKQSAPQAPLTAPDAPLTSASVEALAAEQSTLPTPEINPQVLPDTAVAEPEPLPTVEVKPRLPGQATLQKRPVAQEIKSRELAVMPGSPLAKELNARGINTRTHPGLFKSGGVTDWDNLPAEQWQDYRYELGEDGNGYLNQQGLIDALESEMRGEPVQVGEQADLQAAANAEEAQARFEARDPDPEEIDLGDVTDAAVVIAHPEEDISTPTERMEYVARSVDAAMAEIGMSGRVASARRQEVIGVLNDRGGNVEDAIWWNLHRKADGYAEQPFQPRLAEESADGQAARSSDVAPEVPGDFGRSKHQPRASSGSSGVDTDDRRAYERQAQEPAAPEVTGPARISTFEDLHQSLPKDSKGYPDVVGAGQTALDTATGAKGAQWAQLTDGQKVSAFQAVGGDLAGLSHADSKPAQPSTTQEQPQAAPHKAAQAPIAPPNAQAVEPVTERTDAGEQAVIPGAEQSEERSAEARKADERREIEARQKQSKAGTTMPQDDAGPLFDTQGDMFDAPRDAPSKTQARLTEILGKAWRGREDLPDTDHDEFIAQTAKVREARKAIEEEFGNDVANSALEEIEAEYFATKRAVPSDKKTGQKIQDFGEVLQGAQKHLSANWSERAGDVPDGEIANQPLSKSWPTPNYDGMIEEGTAPEAVAFIHAARDEIPNKPRQGYKVKRWAEQVQSLREMSVKLVSGEYDMEDVRYHAGNKLDGLMGRAMLYEAVGHKKSLAGIRLSSSSYTMRGGVKYSPAKVFWTVNQQTKATAFSNWPREFVVAESQAEAIEKFKAAYDGLDLGNKAGGKGNVKFEIRKWRDSKQVFIGKKVGKDWVDLKNFDDVKSAREFREKNYDDLVKMLDDFKATPFERSKDNSARLGVDHRNGIDATPELFQQEFGFRGVQFGNYVEGPRRQADLNEAYDALMDLAGVIGIPPKAISLNGSLGLAFGARGKGGKNAAAAHYEPNSIVINLTKKSGAGSLAHEWWHGLDNYFSRARGNNAGYVTNQPYFRGEGIRPEVTDQFKAVMKAINATNLKIRTAVLDKRRTKEYWGSSIEMSARSFESYVIGKLQDQGGANDYLANVLSKEAWDALEALQGHTGESYPYATASELPAIRGAFDGLFDVIQTEQTEHGVRMYQKPEEPVAVLSGDELSAEDIKGLRAAAQIWYKANLQGQTATTKAGWEVSFTNRGMRKSTSKGTDLLNAVPAIRAIVENGVLVDSRPGRDSATKAMHFLAAPVEISGTIKNMVVAVRETAEGKFQYDLSWDTSGKAQQEADGNLAQAPISPVLNRPSLSINMGELAEHFNRRVAPQKLRSLIPELKSRLEKLMIRGVDLRIDPVMREQGATEFGADGITILIGNTLNGVHTVNHEAIHVLRARGLFKDAEWDVLSFQAESEWIQKYDIEERYPDLERPTQIEEAIAEAFADHVDGTASRGKIATIFAKVQRFFRAMREALLGQGIHATEDIFEAVGAGEVGARGVDAVATDDVSTKHQKQAQKTTDKAVANDVGEDVNHAVTPDTPIEMRKESFLKAIAKQPIDQAFRIPFAIVGGLDNQGRWKWGKALEGGVRKLVVDKKFKPDGSLRFMNPMLERVRSGMVDRHGQSPDYIERERLRGIEEAAIATRGKEHLQSLLDSGIGPAEAKVLHDILTEGHVDSDKMMALAAPIREAIDDLGAEAAELGLISRESYERNRGTYVHRVYEKHETDEGRFAQWATGLGRSRRRKIIGDQFKGRGVFEQVSAEEIFKTNEEFLEAKRGKPRNGDKIVILDRRTTDGTGALSGMKGPKGKLARRVYWPADVAIPDALADYDNRGTFEVRGTPKSKVTLWRDFSKAERLQMGEIMDARYTVAKTFALMAEDLATGRFFKDIAENEEWSQSTPPEGTMLDEDPMLNSGLKRMWIDPDLDWIKVPDAKIPKSDTFRYGALAGRYVRAEIWRDMEELRILQTPNFFKKMMTQWKMNKTARSPVTHMNNVMSNFILMDMADVRITDLVGAISEFASGGGQYKEAAAAGAFGADMVTQELRDNVLNPLLKEMRDDMRGRRGVGRFGTGKGAFEGGIGRLGWILDRLARGAKNIDQGMLNAYQFEDQLFRMATYMRRRQQGISVEEAAVEARDQFINYDIRAPWINAARATVLPFLSYTYRAIPKIAQTVAERPWKLAKYFAIYQGLNMLAYAAAPSEWDEEEERGSLGDWESGRSWFGTDHMIRMPYLSKGNPVFLNARRWVPGGDVFDMGGGDIPAWLQIGGPIVMGFELYANKQMFTGDEIFNEITDTYPERMWERGKFIYKSAIPSAPWVPGSWYWDKIARARTGEALQWGNNEPYSLPEALLSSVGLKLKPKDVEVGYDSHEFQLSIVERELSGQASSLKRQLKRRLITRKVFDKGMANIQRKRDRVEEHRKELRRKRR